MSVVICVQCKDPSCSGCCSCCRNPRCRGGHSDCLSHKHVTAATGKARRQLIGLTPVNKKDLVLQFLARRLREVSDGLPTNITDREVELRAAIEERRLPRSHDLSYELRSLELAREQSLWQLCDTVRYMAELAELPLLAGNLTFWSALQGLESSVRTLASVPSSNTQVAYFLSTLIEQMQGVDGDRLVRELESGRLARVRLQSAEMSVVAGGGGNRGSRTTDPLTHMEVTALFDRAHDRHQRECSEKALALIADLNRPSRPRPKEVA